MMKHTSCVAAGSDDHGCKNLHERDTVLGKHLCPSKDARMWNTMLFM